jgi:hypothetical protein
VALLVRAVPRWWSPKSPGASVATSRRADGLCRADPPCEICDILPPLQRPGRAGGELPLVVRRRRARQPPCSSTVLGRLAAGRRQPEHDLRPRRRPGHGDRATLPYFLRPVDGRRAALRCSRCGCRRAFRRPGGSADSSPNPSASPTSTPSGSPPPTAGEAFATEVEELYALASQVAACRASRSAGGAAAGQPAPCRRPASAGRPASSPRPSEDHEHTSGGKCTLTCPNADPPSESRVTTALLKHLAGLELDGMSCGRVQSQSPTPCPTRHARSCAYRIRVLGVTDDALPSANAGRITVTCLRSSEVRLGAALLLVRCRRAAGKPLGRLRRGWAARGGRAARPAAVAHRAQSEGHRS